MVMGVAGGSRPQILYFKLLILHTFLMFSSATPCHPPLPWSHCPGPHCPGPYARGITPGNHGAGECLPLIGEPDGRALGVSPFHVPITCSMPTWRVRDRRLELVAIRDGLLTLQHPNV